MEAYVMYVGRQMAIYQMPDEDHIQVPLVSNSIEIE